MKTIPTARLLVSILALPLALACSSSTDVVRLPVTMHVRAAVNSGANAAAQGPQITSLRLLVNQVSLGSGQQFGCQDCQGGADGNEAAAVAAIVSVPLDGSAVNLATEQVKPGTYPEAEIELGGTAPSGWPAGQTVEVRGTSNGAPFTISALVNGSFRQSLSPAVVIGSPGKAIPVVITLPVSSWFVSGSRVLDPGLPGDRLQIEGNIKASFAGPETGSAEKAGGEK